MKTIAFLFLATCLLGCSDFADQEHFYVDPRLSEAVTAFFKEAENRGIPVQKDMLSVVIGPCSTSGRCEKTNNTAKITINESFFRSGSPDPIALQYMVYHEFGHYMGREHNDSFSIMNPNTYAGVYHNDAAQREALIDELFKFQ